MTTARGRVRRGTEGVMLYNLYCNTVILYKREMFISISKFLFLT